MHTRAASLSLFLFLPPPFSRSLSFFSVSLSLCLVLSLLLSFSLVQFYASKDAGGLAIAFEQNAVNGSDLLAFRGWPEVATELRLTAFAAREAISLRDAFLAL